MYCIVTVSTSHGTLCLVRGTISTHESALAKLISLHVNVTGPYIFQVYLMEKAGRRPLLLYGMIGMGISAAIITIGLNVKVGKNGLHEPSLPGRETERFIEISHSFLFNIILLLSW